jgi:archaeal flagellin FlaB
MERGTRYIESGGTMKPHYPCDAFTGLEAAIVLIAFVVVAAVFSYVVLGAGFFTSQTAQATVHTGVQQASSSMEVVGNIYGIKGAGNYLAYINVTVALTAGGTPIDLSQMVVSYNDNNLGHNANVQKTATCTDAMAGGSDAAQLWCIGQKINPSTPGDMLDTNSQMVIIVGVPDTATPDTRLTINFQPAVGAVLPITRTVPGGITQVQPLY